MSITVNSIVSQAAGILHDTGSVRYTTADLIAYINDAQRRICMTKPEAYAFTSTSFVVAGAKQTLPTGGLRLLDVYRNITSGGVIGRSIRAIERAVLDQEDPDWQRRTGSYVEHYCYEPENDPKIFWIFPAISANRVSSSLLELSIAADPPEVAAGQTPVVDPTFHEAIIHYVVSMAISRDAEFGDQLNRAQFHAQAFSTGIGVRNPNNAAL